MTSYFVSKTVVLGIKYDEHLVHMMSNLPFKEVNPTLSCSAVEEILLCIILPDNSCM